MDLLLLLIQLLAVICIMALAFWGVRTLVAESFQPFKNLGLLIVLVLGCVCIAYVAGLWGHTVPMHHG